MFLILSGDARLAVSLAKAARFCESKSGLRHALDSLQRSDGGVCLKISERNWLGPRPRLEPERKGRFQFFFGGKF